MKVPLLTHLSPSGLVINLRPEAGLVLPLFAVRFGRPFFPEQGNRSGSHSGIAFLLYAQIMLGSFLFAFLRNSPNTTFEFELTCTFLNSFPHIFFQVVSRSFFSRSIYICSILIIVTVIHFLFRCHHLLYISLDE